MKTKYTAILSVLMVSTLLITSSFKKMANPLLGKWELKSKTEQKIQDGNVMETSQKNYKSGKKTYEFMVEDKLVIAEDYGKTKEKKKYFIEGSNVYIGKEKTPNNMYTITLKGNATVLFKTKTKTKEGKTTVETDELILQRIVQ